MPEARGRLRLPGRDTLLGAALLLALAVVAALTASRGSQEQPYRLDSTGREGLQALSEWLQALGYPVEQTGTTGFEVPEDAALLFVYPGRRPYLEAEAGRVAAWITAGHTAVLVNAGDNEAALESALHITGAVGLDLPAFGPAQQRQPLLPSAPASLGRTGQPGRQYLGRAPGGTTVLATANGEVTAALSPVGRGTVWHLSAVHGLTNADLRDGNGGYLALAILRTVPAGGRVLFDTYHQSAGEDGEDGDPQIRTLQDWLYRTPPGWAVLMAAVLLLAGLVIGGRRLGPALPAAEELRRREMVEHVAALAALQRRAHQRPAIARHHRERLKAALARRVHFSAGLADEDFVARWADADLAATPERRARARQLLASLEAQPDEATLVRLVAQVDELLTEIGNL